MHICILCVCVYIYIYIYSDFLGPERPARNTTIIVIMIVIIIIIIIIIVIVATDSACVKLHATPTDKNDLLFTHYINVIIDVLIIN